MAAGERGDLLGVVDDEHRPPLRRFGGLLVDLEKELARSVGRPERHAQLGGDRPQRTRTLLELEGSTGGLGDELGQRGAAPRRRQVEVTPAVAQLGGLQQLVGQPRHQLFGEGHQVGVVEVGGVQLEQRELGVVPGGQPFVPEHPPDLEDPLEAPHHQPLEVQLRRDAQVQVDVERVVVGDERLGGRATRDGLEHRGLHFHEPAVLEPATHEAQQAAAQRERAPAVLVGPQVDVALAVAQVHVGDPPPLVAEPAPRLGEQDPLVDLDRQLAGAGLDRRAGGADPIADAQFGERGEVGGHGGQGEQLDRPRAVAQLGEGQPALRADEHQAPGHAGDPARLRPRLEVVVGRVEVGRQIGAVESVGEVGHRRCW